MALKQYQLEYVLEQVALDRLWKKVSTEAGLGEWITGEVKIEQDLITFYWDRDVAVQARMEITERESVRFRWLSEEEYFELSVRASDLVKASILTITDFSEEGEEAIGLEIWQQQVQALRRALGLRD